MRIEGTFLRSKVARRVVAFFVASALVPVAVTAFLSLGQVQDLLAEQGHARLAQTNEDYASSLYNRLLAVEQTAVDALAHHRYDSPIFGGEAQRLRRQFNAIGFVGTDGTLSPLLGAFGTRPDQPRFRPIDLPTFASR